MINFVHGKIARHTHHQKLQDELEHFHKFLRFSLLKD
jgi:hypothetical protein